MQEPLFLEVMGNSTSNSDSDDEGRPEFKEADDGYLDTEVDLNEKDGGTAYDLHTLFSEPIALRSVAAKIKEQIHENVIRQHHEHIIRWLRDRMDRLEETITLAQFCDMLTSKGVSREEAVKAFQPFDMDGSCTAEVTTMLDAVSSYTGPNVMGELGKTIRILQACSLIPGFVDVYAGDANLIPHHGEKILKYLLRNRAESATLPFPHLNGFNNTCSMRLSVLKSVFNNIRDAARDDSDDQVLAEGEELKPITKCYTSIEVSTNSLDAYRLTNGDPNTFWQSDGAARSHWIRLHVRNNVVIKQLSISVASCDQSYMPELVTVSGGRTPRNLRELKEVRIPGQVTGDVVILKNAKVHYPILQINIKRCHSDGCDTRVHGIKTMGYKVVKDTGLSVMESSAKWYLQILAATVSATVPHAPALRNTVLEQTRVALEHMPPLSLGISSVERPQFLSKHVLEEMESFITELAIVDGKLTPDGLNLLLSLNLARGHVTALLRTVQYLFENADVSLPCMPLLLKMMDTRNSCWGKMGSSLLVTLAGCDGGKSDDSSNPTNVLSHGSGGQSDAYITAEGKTKVNMFFRSSEMIKLTKVRIKVVPGIRGPRRGLIFVFSNEKKEFKLEEAIEKFSIYDKWSDLEYKFSVQVRTAGVGGKPDNPIAYFTFDDDCDEIDIPVSWYPTGQYILVKFLEPRQESAVKLGIVDIKFFGFVTKHLFDEDEQKKVHPPNPSKRVNCSSCDIVHWVLNFLVDLAQDQGKKKGKLSKPDFIDYSGLDLDLLWKLYNLFLNSTEDEWKSCSLLLLELLYKLIPILSLQSSTSKETAESLFQHLCNVIDNPSIDHNSKIFRLAEQLIVDGASLFFPDKESKKQRLFSMMNNVDKMTTSASVSLVFQSLCQFFSSVDPRGLLDLPKVPDQSFEAGKVLEVMQTLIVVAGQELAVAMSRDEDNQQFTYLIRLTGALQTSLLAWCWQQLTDVDTSEKLKAATVQTVIKYSSHVATKAVEACRLLQDKEKGKLEELVKNMNPAFLSSIVRQFVLIIMFLVDHLDSMSRLALLHSFLPLSMELSTLEKVAPSLMPDITSDTWSEMKNDDIVLRTWEVESPHSYDNNASINQVFSCPGATKFILDFDPRCETERRYDYLEFTDAKGVKVRYDQKVGTSKWPRQVYFSGPNLHFIFRSDGSNTEWGYKFKVTAKGSPDIPLSWPYDLQLALTRLFGCLCGATLASNPAMPGGSLLLPDDPGEQDVLRSELWTTLFRGGYMLGKLQRSLSGKYVSDDTSPIFCVLNKFANPSCYADISDNNLDIVKRLKEKILSHRPKAVTVGGEDVDDAIWAVFAALVWHTQQLREDLEKYLQNGIETTLSEGLLQAYNIAESLRLILVSQRQKLTAEESLSPGNNPIVVCREKAVYLLKFAGLTKVQLKNELRSKTSKISFKKAGIRKLEQWSVRHDLAEKYPSFRLVMEFVQDPAWTTTRVHQILQDRSKFATALNEVYKFCSEYIRIMSKNDIFQIPVVLFMQSLLTYQDKFTKHYADGLDGCGLQQEGIVRSNYYSLIRCLVEPFQQLRPHLVDRKVLPAYDAIQACLLHLLDTQWQPYDLSFVAEIKLPDLFFTIAKDTVKMRDITVGSREHEEEVKEYEQCMRWFEECSKGFSNWYKREEDAVKEERKGIQMFVARFCDLLDVEITCDGCGVTLPGRRYRCLQCVDMDLCTTCYSGGVKPEGEHLDEHEFVHLVYKCNKCQAFIVGTRIHCNECEDFDLCLGCHLKEKFPSGHLSTHNVTEIPLVKLRNSQDLDSLIKAYIHQHIWLLFTSLALSLSENIYSNDQAHILDLDYARLAAQLQHKCITIVTHCLEMVPHDADDVIVDGTPNLRMNTLPMERRQEEAFATHSQERIMGLLGAMIPVKDKDPLSESAFMFNNDDFIKLLLKVSRGDSGHEINAQHLAMGLLARVLAFSNSQVSSTPATTPIQETGKEMPLPVVEHPGKETVEYFFNFGSKCLETGMEWACSVARLLSTLSRSSVWSSAVRSHISSCIHTLKDINKCDKPDLNSIYALFVVAGFPEVLSIGTVVEYHHTLLDSRKGVVIKHFTDKHQTLIVDLQSRKRHTIKDHYVSCQSEVLDFWEDSSVAEFSNVILNTVDRIRAGEQESVESLWVLALSLKQLYNSLKADRIFTLLDMFQPEFIQCLVFLASKGTGFSQQWLLKELEVLSLMLYSQEDHPSSKKSKIVTKKDNEAKKNIGRHAKLSEEEEEDKEDEDDEDEDEDEDDDLFDDDGSSSATLSWGDEDETKKLFGKLDEKTKQLFEALHHELKVPMAVLRIMYEMNEGNLEAVIKAIMENFENSTEITSFMDKWKTNGGLIHKVASGAQDKFVDTGIYYHPSLNRASIVPTSAIKETGETHQDLFLPSEHLAGEISEQQRNKSGELLKKELQKHGRFAPREYLARINMAMAILYARHVLTGLLAHWPEDGPVINAALLGCKEVKQIPCVLDLLYKVDNRDYFQKVVQKVFCHCDPASLVPIACMASQFMEEVTLSAVTIESNHNYTSGHSVEKIQLPGASFLTITFDSKCSTAEDSDILQFSTLEDMSKDMHAFSGAKPRWNNFQVPGDTVYYKFIMEGDSFSYSYWGYKFTVTAGTRDSFETGYTILEAILSSSLGLSMPLDDLWRSLTYVACKQTSTQRLKAIQLLLHIIATQHNCLPKVKSPVAFESSPDSLELPRPLEPSHSKMAFDLSLLHPLWILYGKITSEEEESGTLQEPVVRALTELFLQVENLALAWDVVNEYVASMAEFSDVKKSISQGLSNVAIVSSVIGIKNIATEHLELSGSKQSATVSKECKE